MGSFRLEYKFFCEGVRVNNKATLSHQWGLSIVNPIFYTQRANPVFVGKKFRAKSVNHWDGEAS